VDEKQVSNEPSRAEVERSQKSLTEFEQRDAISPDEEWSLRLCNALLKAWDKLDEAAFSAGRAWERARIEEDSRAAFEQDNNKLQVENYKLEVELKELGERYTRIFNLHSDFEETIKEVRATLALHNEKDRYKRALQELKAIGRDWCICSDGRGVASAMISMALDLEEPLQVMRKGKWVAADSCEPLIVKDLVIDGGEDA
jgi:hypothetical protein